MVTTTYRTTRSSVAEHSSLHARAPEIGLPISGSRLRSCSCFSVQPGRRSPWSPGCTPFSCPNAYPLDLFGFQVYSCAQEERGLITWFPAPLEGTETVMHADGRDHHVKGLIRIGEVCHIPRIEMHPLF